jgi:hypothetical protein
VPPNTWKPNCMPKRLFQWRSGRKCRKSLNPGNLWQYVKKNFLNILNFKIILFPMGNTIARSSGLINFRHWKSPRFLSPAQLIIHFFPQIPKAWYFYQLLNCFS